MDDTLPPGHKYAGTLEELLDLPFYWWSDEWGDLQFIPDLIAVAKVDRILAGEFE
jgi:hypothetical protein